MSVNRRLSSGARGPEPNLRKRSRARRRVGPEPPRRAADGSRRRRLPILMPGQQVCSIAAACVSGPASLSRGLRTHPFSCRGLQSTSRTTATRGWQVTGSAGRVRGCGGNRHIQLHRSAGGRTHPQINGAGRGAAQAASCRAGSPEKDVGPGGRPGRTCPHLECSHHAEAYGRHQDNLRDGRQAGGNQRTFRPRLHLAPDQGRVEWSHAATGAGNYRVAI